MLGLIIQATRDFALRNCADGVYRGIQARHDRSPAGSYLHGSHTRNMVYLHSVRPLQAFPLPRWAVVVVLVEVMMKCVRNDVCFCC